MGKSQNQAAEFTLTREEIARLIDAAGSLRNRVLVEVLAYTGIRREEAVNLDIADVDASRLRLVVRAGKGDKARIVPITPHVAESVRALAGRRRAGALFLSTHGKVQRLDVRAVNYIIADAGKRAGLTNPCPKRVNINPHLLRHSFARFYLSQGGDLRKVSQILGHESVEITHRIYGTASEEEIASEYADIMGKLR